MDMVAQDVTKKLKLAILHAKEAATLQNADRQEIQFYSLSGKSVVGPFPVRKGKQGPLA
jgi:hypothetical protein